MLRVQVWCNLFQQSIPSNCMSLKCNVGDLRFVCCPIYAALLKFVLYQAPTLRWICMFPTEAKNLMVDSLLFNAARGMRKDIYTLTFHPQCLPVQVLPLFPCSESTGDADEDLLGPDHICVMILTSSSSGDFLFCQSSEVLHECGLAGDSFKLKMVFLMGNSRYSGGTAAVLCVQELCCAFVKSAWVTECKVSPYSNIVPSSISLCDWFEICHLFSFQKILL